MPFIVNLLIQVVIALVIATIFSNPQDTAGAPAGIADFDFPTASQSRSIPVVWGRQELKAPNQVWAGDFYVEKIKESVRTGFTKKNITVGYKYYIGMQLALCMGGSAASTGIQSITKLRYGDKVAWEGVALPDETVTVDNKNLYGGKKAEGGIYGDFILHAGLQGQAADDYLAEQQGEFNTTHSGVAYVTWLGWSQFDYVLEENEYWWSNTFQDHKGYIGTRAVVKPMRFTVNRYSNTLGLSDGKEKIGIGMNPACILHELLTNQEWGMGWDAQVMEDGDLLAMADTLYDEDLGLCIVWDNERSIDEMLEDILSHIGGYYYEDKQSGKIRFGLFREDYDVETLDTLGRPEVLSVAEYSRTGWEGSINEVSVSYSREDRNFELGLVTANDVGNSFIQGKTVSRSNVYHGVTDPDVATRLAYRDLRTLSLPLARASLVCNRLPSTWEVGKVFKWTEASLNVESVIMRITRVERGNYDALETVVHCVEDIYGLSDAIFAPPTDTEWVPPNTTPLPVENYKLLEVPRGLSATPDSLDEAELIVPLARDTLTNLGFYGHVGAETGVLLEQENSGEDFNPTATLNTALRFNDAAYSATAFVDLAGLDLSNGIPQGSGASQESIVLIGNELICYDSAELLENGLVHLVGVHRGVMNTTVQSHPEGAVVYFLDGGGFIPDNFYSEGETVYLKVQPYGVSGVVDLDVIPELNHLFYGEKVRPYVLADMKVDGNYNPEPLEYAMPEVTWEHNPRDIAAGIIPSNQTGAELLLDTDYTYEVSDASNTLHYEVISKSAGDTAQVSAEADYTAIFGVEVVLPPYVVHYVSTLEVDSTEASTYRAAKLQELQAFAIAPDALATPLNPQSDVILFDGEHFGVTL